MFNYTAGPPQSFTCGLQCPDTYHSGISDRCTIMWERLPTVSCDSLQVSISLRQPDGELVYSDVFSPSVTSTETTPLNSNTTYTVIITAKNVCGTSNCYATSSTAVEGKDMHGLLVIMIKWINSIQLYDRQNCSSWECSIFYVTQSSYPILRNEKAVADWLYEYCSACSCVDVIFVVDRLKYNYDTNEKVISWVLNNKFVLMIFLLREWEINPRIKFHGGMAYFTPPEMNRFLGWLWFVQL